MKTLHITIYESTEKHAHSDIESYLFDISKIQHIGMKSYYSHITQEVKRSVLISTTSFPLEGNCDKDFNLDKLNEYLVNVDDSKIFKITLFK